MRLRILLGSALIGLSALAVTPAAAAITMYTTRAAFDAAIAGQTATNIDFDALHATTIAADPLDSGFVGHSTSVGVDTFTTPDPDVFMFAIGSAPADGTFGASYLAAGTDCACAATLNIITPGVSAIGFDYGSRIDPFGDDPLLAFSPDPLIATLGGQAFTLSRPTGSAQFVGFTFEGATVGGVTLSGIGDTGFTGTEIDLIDVTQVNSAVPEPASWALMMLGFGGLGAILRGSRRRLGSSVTG
jgi:hypothetical protein